MIRFDLEKEFKSKKQVTKLHLNAEFETQKIIAVYGKSGAGKSTLLRMLAGLCQVDHGFIEIDENIWFDSVKKINLPTNKRAIGYLFQDYALFPNMNVLKNIEYGLKTNYDKTFLQRIITITQIGDLLERKPESLSGGQQQRVAFARAVVRKPKLLLLDEPFSALDLQMRIQLQDEILAIKELLNITIIIVTHHLPEVFRLADHVVMIDNGIVKQIGTPSEVFPCEVFPSELFPSDVFFKTQDKTDKFAEVLSIDANKNCQTIRMLIDGKVVVLNLNR